MDLLIELIKKREMNIYDLQISQITQDYLANLTHMKENDIEITSAFTNMAGMLLRIKTKMLIPVEVEKEDPRQELVDQILDFQAQKESAEHLQMLKLLETKLKKRKKEEKIKKQKKGTMQDILNSYRSILKNKFGMSKNEKFAKMANETDKYKYTIEERMDFLEKTLEIESVQVQSFFGGMNDKEELVETFAALLELVKLQKVSIYIEKEEVYIEKMRSDYIENNEE